MIAQRLSMIDGVAQVQVFGAAKYAVRVQLDPTALAYRKHRHRRGGDGDQCQNVSQPTGVLWGPKTAFTLQASGQLTNAAQFRALSVTYRNGAAVQLGALGRVLDDVENNRNASWYNGVRAIVLAVQRQPGTNTVAIAPAVRAAARLDAAGDSRRRESRDAVRSVGRHRSVGARREGHTGVDAGRSSSR